MSERSADRLRSVSAGRFLRSTRRAGEVVLGADGHIEQRAAPPIAPEDRAEAVEAANIIAIAQERAEEILVQAGSQAAAIQHAAYEAERDEGHRDGVAEARGELADALALVQQVAAEAKAVRERMMWSAEREIVELVIAVSETVLGEQVSLESSLVLDTVERALTRAGAQNIVRIRVHPGEREVVEASMTERQGDPPPFRVIDDATVSIGGCVIDTDAGVVDARLDVQLEQVARVLRGGLPEEANRDVA